MSCGLNSDSLMWRHAGALFVRGKLNEESNLCYGEVRMLLWFLPEPRSRSPEAPASLPLSPTSLSRSPRFCGISECKLNALQGGAGTWSDGKLTTRIGRNSGEELLLLLPPL